MEGGKDEEVYRGRRVGAPTSSLCLSPHPRGREGEAHG